MARDQGGAPLRPKTKTVNAFVANHIYLLDSVMRHYVIQESNKTQIEI